MKVFDSDLAVHYSEPTTSLARAFRIERRDGVIHGFTEATNDAFIDDLLYLSAPGLDTSSVESTAGTGVDTAELTILPDDTRFTEVDLIAGRWDYAAFLLFEYNFGSTVSGTNILKRGTLGQVRPMLGKYVVELRSLTQFLQQPVGEVTQKDCRARLGDDRCKVDMTPFTYTLTVTFVTSNRVFRDSSFNGLYAIDWFADGLLVWETGDNANLSLKVRSSAADGTITAALPSFINVQVGDTATIQAGCQKRLTDCINKFDNVLNFQGEPDLPGVDDLTKAPS